MNILALVTVFIITFIFIKIIIEFSDKLGLVDIPNERSSHKKVIPRGAGIAFGSAFFLTFLIFKFNIFINHWLTFLAIFFVFLIGILDDHKDTEPKTKFYVIIVSGVLLYFDNIYIASLGTFFGYELWLLPFAIPFTIFAIAGFTNALNLIDGLDGLAASISIVILSTLFYIGYKNNDLLMIYICSFTISSLVAFLFLNWNPAKIFMGDSGSLFLGFVISVVTIISLKYIHPVAGLFIVAIPVMDTIIVMIRRMRKKQSPFSPDKTHIHHILLIFFQKNVKTTVLFLILLQILFSLAGLMLGLNSQIIGETVVSLMAFLAFIGLMVVFYMIFTGMYRRQELIRKLIKKRRKRESQK